MPKRVYPAYAAKQVSLAVPEEEWFIYKGASSASTAAGCAPTIILSEDNKITGGIYKGGESSPEQLSCGTPIILSPDHKLMGIYKGGISRMEGVGCLDVIAILNYIYPVYQGGRSQVSISCAGPTALGRGEGLYRGGNSTTAALSCAKNESQLGDGEGLYAGGNSKPAALHCNTTSGVSPHAPSLYRGGNSELELVACADPSTTLGEVVGCYAGGTSKILSSSCYFDPCLHLQNPTITASGTLPICVGKTLILTASDGKTYQWERADVETGPWNKYGATKSITTTSSGYFRVTIAGSEGCSKTSDILFAEFTNSIPKPTIKVEGSSTICLDGSVPLVSSDAHSYLWSTGATTKSIEANQPGIYSVTIADANGCIATSDEVEIKQKAMPSPNAIISAGGATEFCAGGLVTLTSIPASYYLWTDGTKEQSINVKKSGSYTVRIGDENGCEATATPINVKVHELTPTVQSSSQVICFGEPIELNVSPIGHAIQWYCNGIEVAGATSEILRTAKAGSYSAKITNSFGCSFTSKPYEVKENSGSTKASITQSASLLCQGSTLELTANTGTAYEWSTLDTRQALTIFKGGEYSVTVTDSYGCKSTATTNVTEVTVAANPTITADGNTTICPGTAVKLIAAGGESYKWNNGSTQTTIDATAAGSYWVAAIDINGCSANSSEIIIQEHPNNKPNVEVTGNLIVCPGENVQLSTTPATSYEWSTGETSQTIAVSAAGSYSVTILDANGCRFTSDQQVITQFTGDVPQAIISSNKIITGGKIYACPNETVELTSNEGSNFLWSTGETTRTIKTSVPGIYYVTTTYGSSCKSTSTPIEIVVRSIKPTIRLNGNSTICKGNTVELAASHGVSFVWNDAAASATQTINVGEAGEYFATVTDEFGCQMNTDTLAISIYPSMVPTVSVNGNQRLCNGETVELASSIGVSYQWSTGEVEQKITVGDAGSYSVTVTDKFGCQLQSNTIVIEKHPFRNTTIDVTGSLTICQNQEVTLQAPAEGASFKWSNGATTQAITIKEPNKLGTYPYSVEVTYPEGCTYTSPEVYIKINRNPTQPEIFSTGGSDVCPNTSIALIATQSDTYSYLWSSGETTFGITATKPGTYNVTVTDKGNGCSSTSEDFIVDNVLSKKVEVLPKGPIDLCLVGSETLSSSFADAVSYRWSTGETTPTIVVNQAGYYNVSVTDAKGCSQTSTYVEVLPGAQIPAPTITPSRSTSLCEGQQVTLTCSISSNYQWKKDGTVIPGANSQAITVSEKGSYTVTVTDAAGCRKESMPAKVKVNPLPQALVIPNGEVPLCAGGIVTLTSVNGTSFSWTTGETTKSVDIAAPGEYRVVITDANGCSATSEIVKVVEVTQKASAPTASNMSACENTTATLKAESGIATPTFTWYASATDKTPAHQGATFTTPAVTSDRSYWVTVRNASLCESDRTEVKVTVVAKPTIVFDLPLKTCQSAAPITLTATPIGGAFSGSGVSGNTFNLAGLTGAIDITYTLNTGCTTELTKTINVESVNVTLVCTTAGMALPGTDVEFVATPTPSGSYTYEFFVNNTLVQDGTSNKLIANTLSNGDIVKVKAINSNGCEAHDDVVANILQSIKWEEPSGSVSCSGSTTVFKVTAYDGYTYTWSIPVGYLTSLSGDGTSTITAVWGDNSIFASGVIYADISVSVACTSPSGNVQTLQRTFRVYRRPQTGTAYGIGNNTAK